MNTRAVTALLLCCPIAFPCIASSEAEMLHVMLQGENADAMQALVAEQDGSITHYLPIINAVGARLEPDQLSSILDTGHVTRFIDDLSIAGREEEATPDEPECNVGGALELKFSPRDITWQLYNKHSKPARLQSITASWPEQLGRATSVHFGSQPLPLADTGNPPGELSVEIPDQQVVALDDQAPLKITFSGAMPQGAALQQRDIDIKASFRGDCSSETIPGYADYSSDFYYSTVAGADNLHRHDIRGQGVTVAVLDSGLWEHPSLTRDTRGKNRVLARYDAIANKTVDEAFDESGHGTHLTSVLAHSGFTRSDGKPTGSFKGVAPDSELVVVKAFNVEGQGEMLDIVRGVQWVVDNREKYDIRVLNLSFASRPRWPYWLDPINQAVMRAWAEGIVVVAAAGNEGPEAMSIGSPGNLPYIITVGATTDSWTPTDRSDDYIPDFSSRGPTPDAHIKPDIVAPGGHITGIMRPGSSLTLEHPNYMLSTGDFVMTGSSQSAALVSGLTALLLQLEPELTPDQIKCKFTSSAEPAINADGLLAYSPFQQGSGQVNIVRAITLGKKDCGNTDLDLASDLAGENHFEGPAIIDDSGDTTLPGLNEMLSPIAPAKGASDTRAWGVKDHIERLAPEHTPAADAPFDWQTLYSQEKERLQQLESSASP
jgi:serine protease AprX